MREEESVSPNARKGVVCSVRIDLKELGADVEMFEILSRD